MKQKILPFSKSYLGKLRKHVGHQTILIPGFRIFLENKNGEILSIRRSDNGKWAFPAGCPELGESMSQCVRREVFEETGLKLQSFECFGFSSNPKHETHIYPNKDKVQSFVLLLYSKKWSGKPQIIDGESLELKFFSLKNLQHLEPKLEHEFASIAPLIKYKKTGVFQLIDE